MEKRKTICLITGMPETLHARRVAKGVFEQCDKYGYNVAVFASMSHFLFFIEEHAKGENNIYSLPNFKLFDGVIIDTVTLLEDGTGKVMKTVDRRIKECGNIPVVCLGIPYGGYHTINGYNDDILREMCRHVVNVHGKRDICVLTGKKGHPEAEERLAVFADELGKLGIELDEDHRIYGDFWYNSGIALAKEMIEGKRPMYEAVITAGDYMGLGLIEELTKHGIRVPEDIIVIGFDATDEAMLAEITLTSYETNYTKTAADAVDYLRKNIDPDGSIKPYVPDMQNLCHEGMSCGCQPDITQSARTFRDSLYYIYHNYTSENVFDNIDIGMLMESYASESLTASATPEECLKNIFGKVYLLLPFVNFRLCLREDWLSYDTYLKEGYPDKMMVAVADSTENGVKVNNWKDMFTIDTKDLVPELNEYTEKPCVFYFAAVHFGDNTLGYAVLQRELSDRHLLNLVFRNWLRLVNNSLEMARAKNRYVQLSIVDNMTGLYNRRGMYEKFSDMMKHADKDDRLMICVIDMDGLKYINDTFGHSEGDEAIITMSRAIKTLCGDNEVPVRAGGDEFVIIGIGAYSDDEPKKRAEHLADILEKSNSELDKPYRLDASIGCVLSDENSFELEKHLTKADEEMYRCKSSRRKNRTAL
ncbi:substrate-binding and GGDEF domain-containing protein [Ruminococcus albus]|uniref:Diguanylate cyclase (GGDEF) domain-containing protein n=1 Tax=Ruminococcus albus TaxID=1264 RepID=A0A1I1J834_RUMAL|nr:GGDEF domain-containing protein [Ruminococcus albus]SFC44757.1 diguanylate cyclase (GGDEF) domain-containing protein [Ruminococcus albus]